MKLEQCTLVAGPAAGKFQAATSSPAAAAAAASEAIVVGMLVGDSPAGSEHGTKISNLTLSSTYSISSPYQARADAPSELTMTDCSFSFETPATAGADTVLLIQDTGRLKATRCSFTGFPFLVTSKEAAVLKDCSIEDMIECEPGGKMVLEH